MSESMVTSIEEGYVEDGMESGVGQGEIPLSQAA